MQQLYCSYVCTVLKSHFDGSHNSIYVCLHNMLSVDGRHNVNAESQTPLIQSTNINMSINMSCHVII